MVTQNETVVIYYGYDNLAIIYWQFLKLPGFDLRIWKTKVAELCYRFTWNILLVCLQGSFGEPQSSDSEELFGAISTFIGQFRKAMKETQQGSKRNKGFKLEGIK